MLTDKWPRRLSQVVGFLVGARAFISFLLFCGLYISVLYIKNIFQNDIGFALPAKIYLIIFCSFLSIIGGGLINQFYDQRKDSVVKPFRYHLQNKLPQKYYLYAYLSVSAFTLLSATTVSWNLGIFFWVYMFLLWLYSHKLSRILIVNTICFTTLTLYPFFGIILYYQLMNVALLCMAGFLFLLLLQIDITKDILTRKADLLLGYHTLSTRFPDRLVQRVLLLLAVVFCAISLVCFYFLSGYLSYYYLCSPLVAFVFVLGVYRKGFRSKIIAMNFYRIWVLVGLLVMLLDIWHKVYR